MGNGTSVLLISPQAWGSLYISKHHYALALVNMGYKVFFVNPPAQTKAPVVVTQPDKNKELFIIESGFYGPLILRYKLRFLYDINTRQWIKRLLKEIPAIDIAWCFETNVIKNLNWLGDVKKIFHVVDPIDRRMIKTAGTADLLVCVSERILQQFKSINRPKKFINHALSDDFIKAAGRITPQPPVPGSIQVGYVGNLFRNIIDTANILTVVASHPEIVFHFFGPYQSSDSALGSDGRSLADAIGALHNVRLHGPVPSAALFNAISGMDIFLLAYHSSAGYDSSNSHKLMEYWATGKTVVSTYIHQYDHEDFNEMIAMTPEGRNDLLTPLFAKVISELKDHNTDEKMSRRRHYALQHSYRNNLTEILEAL